jgi:hypothetical protein
MLIINGSAEFMLNNGERTQGDIHDFNLFAKGENLEEQLTHIEKYLTSRGWDNIELTDNGIIDDVSAIKHNVLMEAFNKAKKEGLAVVVNNTPH